MSIGVLAAINHVQTINAALGPFCVHRDIYVVARKRRAEIYRRRVIVRVLTWLRPGEGDMKSRGTLTLNSEMLKSRAVLDHDFHHRIIQVRLAPDVHVTFNQGCFASLLRDDQYTRKRSQRRARARPA